MRENLIKINYTTNTKRSLTEMNEMAGQELIVVATIRSGLLTTRPTSAKMWYITSKERP